ncbi:MAG: hypothetical protein NC305_19580, partial [Lachnospiraceae bacterium]|nr:hypothetical protein [Lachnospiraceae bacterium]
LGWIRFIQDGKVIALFLAALLFLQTRPRKAVKGSFMLYASAAAVCCMIPVSAAALMLYQTRFYDYEWIWSLAPLTAVTAYGFAEFLVEYWKDFKRSLWKKGLPAALLLLGVLLLCGGLGKTVWNRRGEAQERRYAQTLLEELKGLYGDRQICLWAPRAVMEYAREADGGICLVYGRNMWEPSLNAYTYDIYEPAVTELYQWMEQAGEGLPAGEGYEEACAAVRRCAETARSQGVNCILLPGNAAADKAAELEKALGAGCIELEGCYLFTF